jgi:hypothetical protein
MTVVVQASRLQAPLPVKRPHHKSRNNANRT